MSDREKVIASLKYFSRQKDTAINFDLVNLDAICLLDKARAISGIPYIVTSHHRTPQLSFELSGIEDDAHTEDDCSAFDLKCSRPDGKFDSLAAHKMISALLFVGFWRIGISIKRPHIHCDRSLRLPQPRFWVE